MGATPTQCRTLEGDRACGEVASQGRAAERPGAESGKRPNRRRVPAERKRQRKGFRCTPNFARIARVPLSKAARVERLVRSAQVICATCRSAVFPSDRRASGLFMAEASTGKPMTEARPRRRRRFDIRRCNRWLPTQPKRSSTRHNTCDNIATERRRGRQSPRQTQLHRQMLCRARAARPTPYPPHPSGRPPANVP